MARELKKIDEHGWRKVSSGTLPFFTRAWEEKLRGWFPYINFEHFLYDDAYAVRVCRIGERVTTMPFSDGGDMLSLSGEPLPLDAFRAACTKEFGAHWMLRIHDAWCPINEQSVSGDIVDFSVMLEDEATMLGSFRKTLRHVLIAPPPTRRRQGFGGQEEGGATKATSEADIDRAYTLYLEAMHKAQALALPRAFFDFAARSDEFEVWVWKDGDMVLGTAVFAVGETTSDYLISASNERGKNEHIPHRLLFSVMKEHQRSGKQAMFLGGTRRGDTLETFKRGFRGTEHGLITISDASQHEAARTSSLRSLWGFIPASLLPTATKLVGKHVF